MLNISMIVRAKITEPITDGIRTDSVLYFVALPTYFPPKESTKRYSSQYIDKIQQRYSHIK